MDTGDFEANFEKALAAQEAAEAAAIAQAQQADQATGTNPAGAEAGTADDLAAIVKASAEAEDAVSPEGLAAMAPGNARMYGSGLLAAHVARWNRFAGRLTPALEAAQFALRLEPRNSLALGEQEEALRTGGQWGALARALNQRLANLGPTDAGAPGAIEAVALNLDMAAIYQDRLEDLAQAMVRCRAVMALDPDNATALERLEALGRARNDSAVVSEVLEQKRRLAPSPEARMAALEELVDLRVRQERHDDVVNLLETFLADVPNHPWASRNLLTAYQKTGRWEGFANLCASFSRTLGDANAQAELALRGALARLKRLSQLDAAEQELSFAASLTPAAPAVVRGFVDLYAAKNDHKSQAEALVRLADIEEQQKDKSAALSQAASLYQNQLDDGQRAQELFQFAAQLNPDNADAVDVLWNEALAQKDWEQALALGSAILREHKEGEQRAQTLLHLARASRVMGDHTTALDRLAEATELCPNDHKIAAERAELFFEEKRYAEAGDVYKRLANLNSAALTASAKAQYAFMLGRARMLQGDGDAAISVFEKVLKLEPRHRGTLEALAEAEANRGQTVKAIGHLEALTGATPDVDHKVRVWRQVAELHLNNLRDAESARQALEKALEISPDAHDALHDMLDLYTNAKQWQPALAILNRLKENAEGPLRAKYCVAAGNIANYEIKDLSAALQLYNEALDLRADDLKTFERIDKMLTQNKRWKDQERNYRRMLKRVSTEAFADKATIELALWRGLGEIYRTRLNDYKSAITAFEVAASLAPDQQAYYRRILGELYELAGGDGQAVTQTLGTLNEANNEVELAENLRTLMRLFTKTQNTDSNYWAVSSLVATGQATMEENQYFMGGRLGTPAPARATLTEPLWRGQICAAEEDLAITAVFATVSGAIAHARGFSPEKLALDSRHTRQDQALTDFTAALAQTLDAPVPSVVLAPTSAVPDEVLFAQKRRGPHPILVLGADFTQYSTRVEQAYFLATRLALLRPGYLLLRPELGPTVGELHAILLAALRTVNPAVQTPQQLGPSVAGYADLLAGTLSPQARETLMAVAPRIDPNQVDLTAWVRACRLSINRAGLLMCGDLEVASRLLTPENKGGVSLNRFEQTKDLVCWSLSDNHKTFDANWGFGCLGQTDGVRTSRFESGFLAGRSGRCSSGPRRHKPGRLRVGEKAGHPDHPPRGTKNLNP